MTDRWQPITTAPMFRLKTPKVDLWVERPDGTGYRVPDAFWSGGIWKIFITWSECFGGLLILAFRAQHLATHWMLPPKPPEAA